MLGELAITAKLMIVNLSHSYNQSKVIFNDVYRILSIGAGGHRGLMGRSLHSKEIIHVGYAKLPYPLIILNSKVPFVHSRS